MLTRIIWMAVFASVWLCLTCNNIMHILPLYSGYIVSARRMVMDRIVVVNRPVDPDSTQGSHRPIFFMNEYRARANCLP